METDKARARPVALERQPRSEASGRGWDPAARLIEYSVRERSARFYRLRLDTTPPPGALRFNGIEALPAGQVRLNLSIPANQQATLLHRPSLAAGPWAALTSFPAASTNRVVEYLTAAPRAVGFFRLRAP